MDNFEQLWTGESVRRCSTGFDRVRQGSTGFDPAWLPVCGSNDGGGSLAGRGWKVVGGKFFGRSNRAEGQCFAGEERLRVVGFGRCWLIWVQVLRGAAVRTCSVLFEAVWSLRGPHPPPARGQAPTLSHRERGPEQDLCATFLGERGAERDSGVTLPGERGPEVDRGEGVCVLLLLVIVRLSEGHVYDVMRRSSSWCWVERPETLGVGEGGGYGWLVSTGLLVVSKLSIVKYRNY